ncbi:hypothetical protein [Sporosarcina psychrophila]|uniref:hypothetical protein n=1 Tax=Sporosarcina psychrophila TaxID=1476 RepID=UPI00078C3742|nr:hypothetical protein [Sporosarcina psychrophila]AMQ05278.1 hypothetical protein AZE41_04630 [Sporosarcina psychrophila]
MSKNTKLILCLVNAGMLFGALLIPSLILSSGHEWWSVYTFNMEEISPFNVEISWLKVFIFGFISLVISFFLVKITSEKKK